MPVTAFWQAHRDAAQVYSGLIAEWAELGAGMTAWDLYGGAGVFAAVLADGVGESGRVVTVDTSRGSARAARAALADLPWVDVVTDSVRRVLTTQPRRADVAVLDPPRTGAGREVVDLLSGAGVPRIIHIGCEAASFPRRGALPGAWIRRRGPARVRLVPTHPPRRMRRSAQAVATRG